MAKKQIILVLLLMSAAAAASGAVLTATASPTAASFTWQIGNALPSAATISVRASTGAPAYTVSVPARDEWLTATPSSGTLTASLSVRVNPTSKPAGTYTSVISVTVAGIAAPVTIGVTLVVTAPPPAASLTPLTVTLTAPPLTQTATAQLTITGAPASYTATSASPWLTVSPSVGVVLPGSPATLTMTADASALTPSATVYAGRITVVTVSGGTSRTQTITVNLTANSATPAITAIWPPKIPVGAGVTSLTLFGTGFYTTTVIAVAGQSATIKPTFLDSTHMIVDVPASLLQAPATLAITAVNPAPGGSSDEFDEPVDNSPVIVAVMNAASYDTTAVAPGELLAIFGANLGPSPAVGMADADGNGFVDTDAGGTSVTIDGQMAPIIYSSPTQVNVQTPYEVTAGADKVVSLNFGTGAPATFNVTVAAKNPGLFSLDGSGIGAAAAINHTATTGAATLNATATPAHPNDILELFLTGEGPYAPVDAVPVGTGLLVPPTLTPLPELSPYPAVTIDGLPAVVKYAGPVPYSILGVLQMKVQVPVVTHTGAVPVVVTFGAGALPTFSTQSLINVFVHP